MHHELESHARQVLKEGLAKCSEPQQLMFKRIYANGNLDLDTNTGVDKMPVSKLENAMDQVKWSISITTGRFVLLRYIHPFGCFFKPIQLKLEWIF